MIESTAILSSSAIPVDPSRSLRVRVWNRANTELAVNLRIRQLSNEGKIISTFESLPLPDDTVAAQLVIPLTYGQLISVTATTFGVDAPYGTIYGVIEILSGSVVQVQQLQVIASGNFSETMPLVYPSNQTGNPIDPPGAIVSETFADPGAGNDISILTDPATYARLRLFTATLVADATVADRNPTFMIDVNGQFTWRVTPDEVQTANNTFIYILTPFGSVPTPAAETSIIPMPDWIAGNQIDINTDTTNLQAGDQWINLGAVYNSNVIPA